jgi:hypothetical protein
MMLYAERAGKRAMQVAVDLALVAWIVGAVRLGRWLHELVNELQRPGARLEASGDRFAESFDSVADSVPELPFVGDALRGPFLRVADAGRQVESAGLAQQEAVATLALVLGVLVAALLIGWVLSRYLPWRIGWLREANAAVRLRDGGADIAVFAHRAVANRSLRELGRTVADPGLALVEGRHRALADLELRALGLRTPGETDATTEA